MLFKNATCFNIDKEFQVRDLEGSLREAEVMPLQPQQAFSIGFRQNDLGLVLSNVTSDTHKVRVVLSEKKISSKALKQELLRRVSKIEGNEDRVVSRKEKLDMKDDIIYDWLPTTRTQESEYEVMFNTTKNLVIVSAGRKIAEVITSYIREVNGTLPISNILEGTLFGGLTKGWLLNIDKMPEDFSLGGDVKVVAVEDSSIVVSMKNCEFSEEHIEELTQANVEPSLITLKYKNDMAFKINDKFSLSSINFNDDIQDENDSLVNNELFNVFEYLIGVSK